MLGQCKKKTRFPFLAKTGLQSKLGSRTRVATMGYKGFRKKREILKNALRISKNGHVSFWCFLGVPKNAQKYGIFAKAKS